MKQGVRILGIIFLGMLAAAFLAACGGGGDGGGPDTVPTIEYTGNPEQAIINSSNAEALALAAYEGNETFSSDSADPGLIPLAIDESSTPHGTSVLVALPRIISQKVIEAVASSSPDGTVSALAVSGPTASCGGTRTIVPSETGISGSIIFKDYCETDTVTDIVINGKVTFSGSESAVGSDQIIEATINQTMMYHYLQVQTYETGTTNLLSDQTLAGRQKDRAIITTDLRTNDSIWDLSVRLDMGIEDNVTSETYKVDGYTFGMVFDNTSLDIEISIGGTFYHYEHGYVTLATTDTILASWFESHPYSGSLTITGANGSYLTLTFLTATTYQVTGVDVDGNTINISGTW